MKALEVLVHIEGFQLVDVVEYDGKNGDVTYHEGAIYQWVLHQLNPNCKRYNEGMIHINNAEQVIDKLESKFIKQIEPLAVEMNENVPLNRITLHI